MHIDISTRGEVSVAALAGAIDGKTAPEVQDRLMPLIADNTKIVIDMSKVSFLSSAGLRILLLLYRQASSRNGKIALAGLPDPIQDVMSMTGFLNYFKIAASVDEAVEAVQ
jgi:anti-sigma B factor antagonist